MSKYETKAFRQRRLELKDQVISLYNSLKTLKAVAEELNIHPKTVARILKDNNIIYKSRGEVGQLVWENPFKNKSIEDKSYWIGFISGDGYIDRYKNRISIISNDYEIIEKFKAFVGNNISIRSRVNVYTNTFNISRETTTYVASFSNKDSKDYLTKRGVTTKKSKTLELKVKLNWDIIRGLFDADGSMSGNQMKITTGSRKLVHQLYLFFKEQEIKVSIKDKGTGTCWDVYILGGKQTMTEIYKHFYQDRPYYYLSRKKEQIRRYIE